jgi:cation diffusion facilitator family transporter
MVIDRLQRGVRATFVGMAINALLAIGKLAAGILGNSHALIAYAVESLADIFSAVVVWRSLVLAAKPADEDHPYGHGKAEPIASAIVATMLLLAATGIGLKSIQGIVAPSRGAPAAFTLVV